MLSYLLFIATVGGIYGLLALSLNLIWGGAGMVNLGLAGFFAVGAYASALLTTAGHAPIAAGWLLALLAGGVAGLIVTLSTTRLREDYLAIVTLGFAEVVRLMAANEIWLTRGADGISGIPGPWKRASRKLRSYDCARFSVAISHRKNDGSPAPNWAKRFSRRVKPKKL